jgi:hypothetical protein
MARWRFHLLLEHSQNIFTDFDIHSRPLMGAFTYREERNYITFELKLLFDPTRSSTSGLLYISIVNQKTRKAHSAIVYDKNNVSHSTHPLVKLYHLSR